MGDSWWVEHLRNPSRTRGARERHEHIRGQIRRRAGLLTRAVTIDYTWPVALKGKHGAMLAGRYRLLEQLGVGGMGSVWRAEHVVLRSHVAIKIIDPDVARSEFNLARFLREAKTLASLRSPNVVQVLDFGSDAETPYLVMELLEGQTLGSRLTKQGRLSIGETSHVLHDVCMAMALVHEQGLIHRDLKPDNIFLCEVGEQRVAKIVDFGIAKSMRPELVASMKTRTGHMLGTPSYMSPEQCRGLKDIDHRADLWALGVIVYECLVGKVPFEGEVLGDLLLQICMDPMPIPSRQLYGVLPSGFDAWFAKAVARDREQRFQSALELSESLAGLAAATARHGTSTAPEAREGARASAPVRSAPAASSAPVRSAPAASSAPVRSAPAASLAPQVGLRQTPNTETNTTVGLGGIAGFKGERRAQLLALGALSLAVALGLWVFGTGPEAEAETRVGVQGLRPPYAATPKVLRKSVPSGRPWQVSPAAADPVPAGGSAAAGADLAAPATPHASGPHEPAGTTNGALEVRGSAPAGGLAGPAPASGPATSAAPPNGASLGSTSLPPAAARLGSSSGPASGAAGAPAVSNAAEPNAAGSPSTPGANVAPAPALAGAGTPASEPSPALRPLRGTAAPNGAADSSPAR
jgi:tRNA A-37 threonylcarbamoyl transferase component Bud32